MEIKKWYELPMNFEWSEEWKKEPVELEIKPKSLIVTKKYKTIQNCYAFELSDFIKKGVLRVFYEH